MIILGIEASAKVAGAAVYKDGMIVAASYVNGTLTHSETLMPMIRDCMEKADVSPRDLSAIALSAGPGSFTGLRIGAATAKGMADALGIPLVPLSTLEVIAANIGPTEALIVPMMDARRKQVYGAAYQYEENAQTLRCVVSPDAYPPEVLAEKVLNVQNSLQENSGARVVLVGDGAAVYASDMKQHLPGAVLSPVHLRYASPDTVADLGALYFEQGKTVSPKQLQIDYLRKPQAEREREERLQNAKE